MLSLFLSTVYTSFVALLMLSDSPLFLLIYRYSQLAITQWAPTHLYLLHAGILHYMSIGDRAIT